MVWRAWSGKQTGSVETGDGLIPCVTDGPLEGKFESLGTVTREKKLEL